MCAQITKKERNSFKATVAELELFSGHVEDMLSSFSIDPKNRNLCTLLFEEISKVMKRRLPEANTVEVRVHRRSRVLSIHMVVAADEDILKEKDDHSGNDDSQVEEAISEILIDKNSDKINSRFNKRRRLLRISIEVGRSKGRNYEDEIEEYYNRYKNNPPKATSQMWFLYKQRIWGFLLSVLIKVGRSAPVVIIPIVTANVIDIVSTTGIAENLRGFVLNLAIGVISLLLNILFSYLESAYFRNLCRKVGVSLRNVMVRKLQLFSISFHKGSQAGAITNKMIMNIESISDTFCTLIGDLAIIILYIIMAVVMTLRDCPLMSLFYLFFIPLAVVLAWVFRRPIGKVNKEYRMEMEETNAAVTEMLGMVEMTRAHGLQKDEMSRMSHYVERIRFSGTRLDIINQVLGSISWVLLQVFQLISLAFSAYLASRKIITIGMIALFQSYFSMIVTRVSSFVNALPVTTKGFEACNSIAEVLCADADEHTGTKRPARFYGEIDYSDVSFCYSGQPNVLNDFSLHIPAKSSIAFVGGSGSGKSTLINLMIGFMIPQKGSVTVDGISLKDMKLSSYRKHVAIVPQNSVLFSGTLYENLTYGAPFVSRSRVNELLKAVGLDDFVNSLPNGLETMIVESGANLSGGQRQRISIVRALLRDPKILILDEATSALDNENEKKIGGLINNILGTCTVVMIAHRLSTIKNVDRIIVLDQGRIIEDGNYDELMAKEGVFYNMGKNSD